MRDRRSRNPTASFVSAAKRPSHPAPPLNARPLLLLFSFMGGKDVSIVDTHWSVTAARLLLNVMSLITVSEGVGSDRD